MKTEDDELWIDVPETGARVQASNRGRLRVVGKKTGRGRRVILCHVNEERRLVCDYKTGLLGWYVFFDGKNHFFERDALMRRFPPGVADVDRSHDEEARRKRDETFIDLEAKRKEGADVHGEDS